MDKDYPAFNLGHSDWTKWHFMSREQVLPSLLMNIAMGSTRGFEYAMHQWQDSYVHWDRGYRAETGGHFWDSLFGKKVDEREGNEDAYNRCEATTRRMEDILMKFNKGEYSGFSEFTKFDLLMRAMLHKSDDLWMTDNGRREDITDY